MMRLFAYFPEGYCDRSRADECYLIQAIRWWPNGTIHSVVVEFEDGHTYPMTGGYMEDHDIAVFPASNIDLHAKSPVTLGVLGRALKILRGRTNG